MRWRKRLAARRRWRRQPAQMPRPSTEHYVCYQRMAFFVGQGGGYAHTPSSLLLRSDHPQPMRTFVRMQGIPTLWHIWEHFAHALRTGRSAAEKSLPDGFWGYFANHPEHSRLFNDAMTAKTHGQSTGLLAAYDFSAFNTIADIGGGNGHSLLSILTANPTLQGVLFDLPHVIQ